MSTDIFVSPNYTLAQLNSGVVDKVTVFEDQMKGWILDQANVLALDTINAAFSRHAGFAILMLCSAYFETLESCSTGQSSEGKSKEFFRKGFKRVFPTIMTQITAVAATTAAAEKLAKELIDSLYSEVRCGLYHRLSTKRRVILTRNKNAVGFEIDKPTKTLTAIEIDPWAFLDDVAIHFNRFVADLRTDADLRAQFEQFFDTRNAGPTPVLTAQLYVTPAKSTYP